jgi:hypothetical protein
MGAHGMPSSALEHTLLSSRTGVCECTERSATDPCLGCRAATLTVNLPASGRQAMHLHLCTRPIGTKAV